MTPLEADNEQLAALERDNYEVGDFWILTDGYRVTIAEQPAGSPASQSIVIPIEVARELLGFMTTDQ